MESYKEIYIAIDRNMRDLVNNVCSRIEYNYNNK